MNRIVDRNGSSRGGRHADLALPGVEDYRMLTARFDGRSILASGYAGRRGVPALFPRTLFDALLQLKGDLVALGVRDIR